MPHPKFLYGTRYSTPGFVFGYQFDRNIYVKNIIWNSINQIDYLKASKKILGML